jgi:hypothetical protein
MTFFAPHLILLALGVADVLELIPWWYDRHVITVFVAVTIALPPWCRWRGRGWPGQRAFVLGPVLAAGGFLVAIVANAWNSGDLMAPLFAAFMVALVLAFLGYARIVFDR